MTYLPLELQFSNLPVAHRFQLDQTALFYGLTGYQLHYLIWNSVGGGNSFELNVPSSKRQRITYQMAPQHSIQGIDGDDQERMPRTGPPEQGSEPTGPASGLGGSYSFALDGTRIASSLASLKVVCQNCLTRCDGQDSMCSPPILLSREL